MNTPEPGPITLVVGDRALASLAAHATDRTPGVVRLHPSPRQASKHAVRRLAGRSARRGATVVDVDREPHQLTITVRVSIDTSSPVQQLVDTLQRRVVDELTDVADVSAIVVVHVLDVSTP